MKRKVFFLDFFGIHHFETIVDENRFRVALDYVCEKAKAANLPGYAKSEIIESC